MEDKIWHIRNLQVQDIIQLLRGAQYTLLLSCIAISLGLILAIIVAIMRTVKVPFLNHTSRIYVEIFRGTPVLIQIFMFYYGLRIFNIRFPALFSASLAFVFNVGANVGETLKGIIDGIPKSQWDASESLGFNYFQQLIYVILPQVVKTAIPPTIGIFVGLIKDTSLASIVGFVELARAGARVMAMTNNPYTTFPIVAAIYFIICFPLTIFSRKLERKLE
jgi:polar amino acid transport system permease protein